MHRILIIEENTEVSDLLSEKLKRAGYSCTQAFSGTEGLFFLERDPFSLVILEQSLSGLSSEELISRMPKAQQIPVILLSAQNVSDNMIQLTPSDAGPYKIGQAEIQSLIAQIERKVKGGFSGIGAVPKRTLKYRDLSLNTASYIASIRGTELPLTRQEFKILELLVSHPSKVFTKQEIYDYAWDDFYAGDNKTINVHISNIRRKLREHSDFKYIKTVWGYGFQLGK